jgi:hypothetical protein
VAGRSPRIGPHNALGISNQLHATGTAALERGEQLVVTLPDGREEHLAQGALGPLVDVHQHGDLLRIVGPKRGTHFDKLEAQRLDMRSAAAQERFRFADDPGLLLN